MNYRQLFGASKVCQLRRTVLAALTGQGDQNICALDVTYMCPVSNVWRISHLQGRRIVASHGEGFPFDEDSILQIRYPTRIHCIRMNEQRKKFKYMIKKAFPIVSSKGDRSQLTELRVLGAVHSWACSPKIRQPRTPAEYRDSARSSRCPDTWPISNNNYALTNTKYWENPDTTTSHSSRNPYLGNPYSSRNNTSQDNNV